MLLVVNWLFSTGRDVPSIWIEEFISWDKVMLQGLLQYLSCVMRKPTMWFLNRIDTNRAVQAQKMARDGKCWILKVEELYYPCSENKGADQLPS